MKAKVLFVIGMCFFLVACGRRVQQKAMDTQQPGDAVTLAADSLSVDLSADRPVVETDSLPAQQQLDALMEEIRARLDSAPLAVRANVMMYGTGLHTIDVWLIVNTPERRRAFQEKVLDSSVLRFYGSTGKEPCNRVGVSDTLGVSLVPEYASFPVDSKDATFLLCNEGTEVVTCGKHYSLAYERDGKWYELPINSYAEDIGYAIKPGGMHRFTGNLHPLVNDNHAGRYRFYTEVWIGDKKVLMMAEFVLAGE